MSRNILKIKERLNHLLFMHGERDSPLVFSGRETILEYISETAEALKNAPLKGKTFVVHGAPGAGKTALMDQVAKEIKGRGCETLMYRNASGTETIREMEWCLLAKLRNTTVEKLTRGGGLSGRVSGSLTGAESIDIGVGMDKPPLGIPPQFNRPGLKVKGKPKPIVLFIDEAQNLTVNETAKSFIGRLHTQAEQPVLLVCAGLSNTLSHLYKCGISARLESDNVFSIGGLDGIKRVDEDLPETRNAVDAAFEVIVQAGATYADERSMDTLKSSIVTASGGWPRHLTVYFREVLKGLIGSANCAFDELDNTKVLTEADLRRDDYYLERQKASGLSASIISDLYETFDERGIGASLDECSDALDGMVRTYAGAGKARIQGAFKEQGSAFMSALHAGVISYTEREECVIPIPSMRTYISRRARIDKVRHANAMER